MPPACLVDGPPACGELRIRCGAAPDSHGDGARDDRLSRIEEDTMKRCLVAYATKYGSTEDVAREIASTLRRGGHIVYVQDAETVDDLREYDAVVLGGALYMGRWHRDARAFVELHHQALARLPFAVFALGPASMDKEAGSRKQLQHALGHAQVEPHAVAIFGGVVDPAKLRFPFNHMPKTDARDWPAIERWALEVLGLIEQEPAAVT
jgi:menaquinone-dependent protoporphyrinogen oxidase